MNSKNTCNRDQKLFQNNTLNQFATSSIGEPSEIIYHDEEKYLKIFRDTSNKHNLKENLVDPDFSNSQRMLEVDCTFNTSKDADNFINEISREGLYYLFAIEGHKGAWNVTGSITVQLGEMPKAIKIIENIINKYHTHQFIDCASTSYLDWNIDKYSDYNVNQ